MSNRRDIIKIHGPKGYVASCVDDSLTDGDRVVFTSILADGTPCLLEMLDSYGMDSVAYVEGVFRKDLSEAQQHNDVVEICDGEHIYIPRWAKRGCKKVVSSNHPPTPYLYVVRKHNGKLTPVQTMVLEEIRSAGGQEVMFGGNRSNTLRVLECMDYIEILREEEVIATNGKKANYRKVKNIYVKLAGDNK